MRNLKQSKAYLITDLQFGSTGKGLIAGRLAKELMPDVTICAWTPNAGHTYVSAIGEKFIHRAIPHGVLSPRIKAVLLGPNSVIDARRVIDEMQNVAGSRDYGSKPLHLVIHPAAVLLRQSHRDWEEEHLRHNGSTRKGSAAAQIAKLARPEYPVTMGQLFAAWRKHPQQFLAEAAESNDRDLFDFIELLERFYVNDGAVQLRINDGAYEGWVQSAHRIQVEGAQGYSLGVNGRFFPYCTARDVTPLQIFSDCGLPLSLLRETFIIGTMRTYPIRVNNREGYSGDCYSDQHETTFTALGVPEELTTVTKLPRRIFTLSALQTRDAAYMCSPDAIFLNFCNYMCSRKDTTLGGSTSQNRRAKNLGDLIEVVEESTRCPVAWLGWGERHDDVEEVPHAL